MEAIEVILKMLGLFLFYGICFVFGMAIFIFVSFLGILFWVSGLLGVKNLVSEGKEEKADQSQGNPPCQ